MTYDERPPWIRLLPDPDPPTFDMMGGKLREMAPSLHKEVEGLLVEHPPFIHFRSLTHSTLRLFELIVDGLPPEQAMELVPLNVATTDPSAEMTALRLLTRATRWRFKEDKDTYLNWYPIEIYEYSNVLSSRGQSPHVARDVREAAHAAHQLFLRVALALADLYEIAPVECPFIARARPRTT